LFNQTIEICDILREEGKKEKKKTPLHYSLFYSFYFIVIAIICVLV